MRATVNIPGEPMGHGSSINDCSRGHTRIPVTDPMSILDMAQLSLIAMVAQRGFLTRLLHDQSLIRLQKGAATPLLHGVRQPLKNAKFNLFHKDQTRKPRKFKESSPIGLESMRAIGLVGVLYERSLEATKLLTSRRLTLHCRCCGSS